MDKKLMLKCAAGAIFVLSTIALGTGLAHALGDLRTTGADVPRETIAAIKGGQWFSVCTATNGHCNSLNFGCPFIGGACSTCSPNFIDKVCQSAFASCTTNPVKTCGPEYSGTCTAVGGDPSTTCTGPFVLIGPCAVVNVRDCT